jgi:hypothetical protein
MRSFAEKPKARQWATSPKSSEPTQPNVGGRHEVGLPLHLQGTIGNQSVLRLLRHNPESPEVEASTHSMMLSGHDFSRIPVHSYSLAADRSCHGTRMKQWSERAMSTLWESGRTAPTPSHVAEALRSPGEPLNSVDRTVMESRFSFDFSRVRIHSDARAAQSAEKIGAEAYAAGRHIVFARGQYAPGTEAGRSLLSHELAHLVHQGPLAPGTEAELPSKMVRDASAESAAEASSAGLVEPLGRVTVPFALRPSIAEKILKFAAKQLEKRTVRTVSKHIARHARRIAGRAIHSIFKNPKEIRYMLQRTVREATEIAAKHPTAGTEHIIEESGIRITRQATGTPGKFRLLIQKVFDKEIGTQGERVLRIVLDQTGRIVSAFPADRLAMIGLTAAGLEAFTAGTARAGVAAQAQVARAEEAEKAREDQIGIWEWVPIIGDIWGGSLNEGEDEMLRQEREIASLVKDTIDDVERSEQRTLGVPERRELEQLIRTAIASPLVMEDSDPE